MYPLNLQIQTYMDYISIKPFLTITKDKRAQKETLYQIYGCYNELVTDPI